MISPIVQTPTAPSVECAKDISQEKMQTKTNSPYTGSQTKLFLMTAPVSSLFRLRKLNRNTYASLQHYEIHKLRVRVAKDLSRAIILALKNPMMFEPPFYLSFYSLMPNQCVLCDCHDKIVTDIYADEKSVEVAARLLNISAERRLVTRIESCKPVEFKTL